MPDLATRSPLRSWLAGPGLPILSAVLAVAAAIAVAIALPSTTPALRVSTGTPLGGLPLSPDGRWAVPHTQDGHAVVSTDPNAPHAANGQPIAVVSWKGHSGGVAWSPDSRYVAWYGSFSAGAVTIYDLEHPETTPRTISVTGEVPGDAGFDGMLWSSDGLRILFETSNCEYPCSAPGSATQLYTIDLAEGSVQVVSRTLPPGPVTSWAPDGKSLGFTGGLIVDLHGAMVIDLLPTVSDAVFPAPMTCLSGPVWSPDGSRVAIIEPLAQDAGRLLVLDPGVSEPRVLAASACAIIGWSPDGALIVFRTGDSFATKWVQQGQGGSEQPTGSGSDLWIVAVEGGTAQLIKHVDWGQVPILTWSGSGK